MSGFYRVAGLLFAALSLLAAPDTTVNGDIMWGTLLICSVLCVVVAEIVETRRAIEKAGEIK